jgi:hypothetical protein
MSDHLRRLQFAAPSASPDVEHVRIGGLRPRFVPCFSRHFLVFCSCDVTSAKPITESTALRSQARRRSDGAPHVQIITLPRRYACQKSIHREMRSARPLTVNNSGIDARNGQAYHGRKTTTTNGTRPAVSRSCSREGQRKQRQRRGCVASRVRSRPGAAGRTRVPRAGTEAAVANDPMRCRT